MLILNSLLAAFIYINDPHVLMRESTEENARVASDAIYSERVSILEEQGDFAKIQTDVDQYVGWVKKESLITRENPYVHDAITFRKVVHLYHVEDTEFGAIITLPFESRLKVIEPQGESNCRWLKVALLDGRELFVQRGDISFSQTTLTKSEMCDFSHLFLGLPYTWGGRSSFGYDCSGFAQMLYRQMGIFLPRDSGMQMNWEGFREVELDDLKAGDLIFFGAHPNRIWHVGLCLGERSFIHSVVRENKPWLRISSFDDAEYNGSVPYSAFRAGRTLKNIEPNLKKNHPL